MAFLFTFSTQLFKPFLAATPLGAVEPLQMTISPRQLFSRVLPLGTMENCLDSPHLPASDHRTSWLLTNHEFAGGHLLRLGRNRHQLLPTSPAMAITCCHCSWISACRQLASIALAETLKPNSHSTSPNPMEITPIQLQRHFSVALMASRPYTQRPTTISRQNSGLCTWFEKRPEPKISRCIDVIDFERTTVDETLDLDLPFTGRPNSGNPNFHP